MKYEEKIEEVQKWEDYLSNMIFKEKSFNNKIFTMSLTKKISKDDREEISNILLENNETILSEIKSTSKEVIFICKKDLGIYEILDLIEKKTYFNEKLLPLDYITDENQSVVWNREQVERHNIRVKELKRKLNKYNQVLDTMLIDAVIEDEIQLNPIIFDGIPKEVFLKIWSKAYQDGHSCGYQEVISYFRDEMDLFEDILKIMKKVKN